MERIRLLERRVAELEKVIVDSYLILCQEDEVKPAFDILDLEVQNIRTNREIDSVRNDEIAQSVICDSSDPRTQMRMIY